MVESPVKALTTQEAVHLGILCYTLERRWLRTLVWRDVELPLPTAPSASTTKNSYGKLTLFLFHASNIRASRRPVKRGLGGLGIIGLAIWPPDSKCPLITDCLHM